MQNFTPDMSDDELDRLFREAAAMHQPQVPAENWQEIARRLEPGRPGQHIRFRRWLWIGVATAAAAGWLSWKLWLQPQVSMRAPEPTSQQTRSAPSGASITTSASHNHTAPAPSEPARAIQQTQTRTSLPSAGASAQPSSMPGIANRTHIPDRAQPAVNPQVPTNPRTADHQPLQQPTTHADENAATANRSWSVNLPPLNATTHPQIHLPVQQTIHLSDADFKRFSTYRWTFSIMTGPTWARLPDKPAAYSSFGTGWMLNVRLSSRLHAATGMLFSRANYNGTADDYHMPLTPEEKENIKSIQAACKITDVPLNLQWDIVAGSRQRLFVAAGISSYFMRKEDYRYAYKRYMPGYPWHVSLDNVNEHFFAIGNLSIGFEQFISPHFSVQVEPYLKLPLSDIGYGQVRLQSLGSWFSLNYHF